MRRPAAGPRSSDGSTPAGGLRRGGCSPPRTPEGARAAIPPDGSPTGRSTTTSASWEPNSGEYPIHDLVEGQAGRVDPDRPGRHHQRPYRTRPVLGVPALDPRADGVDVAPLLRRPALRPDLRTGVQIEF